MTKATKMLCGLCVSIPSPFFCICSRTRRKKSTITKTILTICFTFLYMIVVLLLLSPIYVQMCNAWILHVTNTNTNIRNLNQHQNQIYNPTQNFNFNRKDWKSPYRSCSRSSNVDRFSFKLNHSTMTVDVDKDKSIKNKTQNKRSESENEKNLQIENEKQYKTKDIKKELLNLASLLNDLSSMVTEDMNSTLKNKNENASDQNAITNNDLENKNMVMDDDDKDLRMTAQRQRINHLVDLLSERFVPAQTIPFYNLVNQGDWELVFNSWQIQKNRKLRKLKLQESSKDESEQMQDCLVDEDDKRKEKRDRITSLKIYQTIEPDMTSEKTLSEGTIINNVLWEYEEEEEGGVNANTDIKMIDKDNDQSQTQISIKGRKSKGCMAIDNKYKINSRSTMDISLQEHRLLPDVMPKDPNNLITNLQKLIPFNIFDPNESEVLTVYVDEDVKITFTTTQDTKANPAYQQKGFGDSDNKLKESASDVLKEGETADVPKEIPARYNNVLSIYIRKAP